MFEEILRKSNLTYDQMLTILKEVQNTLNNRPLTYVYYDDQVEPLTPNKLLYGRNIYASNVDDTETEGEQDVEKNLRHVRTVLQHFWNKWQFEYLTELREHNKNIKKVRYFVPNVGDVVLVYDNKLKRCLWKMGKVVKLIQSKDGIVRAADVHTITKTGRNVTLRRPINKLYPIELNKKDDVSADVVEPVEPGLTFIEDKEVTVFGPGGNVL